MAFLDHLFASAYDRVMAPVERARIGELRAELLAGLSGRVLDLGAGTGANLPHLPDAVRSVVLVEPSGAMVARLEDKLGAAAPEVEVVNASAESLPLQDDSVDHAVATLVLCTVDDPDRALAELARVIRPGGSLVLLEHVAADGLAGTTQRVLEPVWKVAARGCRLTRDTRSAVEAAGFDVSAVVPVTWPGPRFVTTGIAGVAPLR